MIKLTSQTNTPVAINAKQVLYVKEAPTKGCVIIFANEKQLHVQEDYLEVITSIGNALS